MKSRMILRYALMVGSLFATTPSMADTFYDFNATSKNPALETNFAIGVDDQNNDGLLSSTAEIISFSGVTLFGSGTFTSVLSVPDISGFANGGAANWLFGPQPAGVTSVHGPMELQPQAGAGPRPHRRCRTGRPDLGERWPSRLVATAEEDRLKNDESSRLRVPTGAGHELIAFDAASDDQILNGGTKFSHVCALEVRLESGLVGEHLVGEKVHGARQVGSEVELQTAGVARHGGCGVAYQGVMKGCHGFGLDLEPDDGDAHEKLFIDELPRCHAGIAEVNYCRA
jgi:hypothetical protein